MTNEDGDGSDDTAADASVEAALADWKLGAQEAAREVGAAAQQDAARQAAELAELREVAVEHENAVSAGVARVCELETELQAVTAANTVAEASWETAGACTDNPTCARSFCR